MATPATRGALPPKPPFAESKVVVLLVASALLVCAVVLTAEKPGHGAAIVAATLAATLVGAILGFLFGIPRSLAERGNTEDTVEGSAGGRSGYAQNTNLEQISDWLTKIVVGVGLVEAQDLATQFNALAQSAAASWQVAGGAVTAGALLLASAVTGFLACYIWTRTTFLQLLVYSDRLVAAERQGRQEAEAQLDHAVQFMGGGPVSKPQPSELTTESPLKAAVRRALPDLVAERTADVVEDVWESDPNKGQFGGSAAVAGRRLEADIAPLGADGKVCTVVLRVRPEADALPVTGRVVFHLHPTFSQPTMSVMPSKSGVAELRLLAAGAFTVGVEIDGEDTRLELDLATVTTAPQAFRQS
jgi:hypothetical protein